MECFDAADQEIYLLVAVLKDGSWQTNERTVEVSKHLFAHSQGVSEQQWSCRLRVP